MEFHLINKRDLRHSGTEKWAHLDLNQGPTDYESAALTN